MVTGGEGAQIGSKIGEITIVDSISVLGIKIDRKLEKLNENWERVEEKWKTIQDTGKCLNYLSVGG